MQTQITPTSIGKAEEDRQILKIIRQRQHDWLSHQSLLLDITEGRIKERPKGGRRMQMLHMLAKDGYVALKGEAEERWRWSHVTYLLYSKILDEEREHHFH